MKNLMFKRFVAVTVAMFSLFHVVTEGVHDVKISIVGVSGSGKTAVRKRFFDDFTEENEYEPTKGMHFGIIKVTMSNGKMLELVFRDTTGLEYIYDISFFSTYVRFSNVVLVLVNPNNFGRTLELIEAAIQVCCPNPEMSYPGAKIFLLLNTFEKPERAKIQEIRARLEGIKAKEGNEQIAGILMIDSSTGHGYEELQCKVFEKSLESFEEQRRQSEELRRLWQIRLKEMERKHLDKSRPSAFVFDDSETELFQDASVPDDFDN
ncbi:MAG: hypothetical protein LBK29_03510 [Oscillospiraceae bacterium]|nr:hypothetical protein [Oscillospiraceae bacterium]